MNSGLTRASQPSLHTPVHTHTHTDCFKRREIKLILGPRWDSSSCGCSLYWITHVHHLLTSSSGHQNAFNCQEMKWTWLSPADLFCPPGLSHCRRVMLSDWIYSLFCFLGFVLILRVLKACLVEFQFSCKWKHPNHQVLLCWRIFLYATLPLTHFL